MLVFTSKPGNFLKGNNYNRKNFLSRQVTQSLEPPHSGPETNGHLQPENVPCHHSACISLMSQITT